jgi:putative spermidine/putrescine transport system ATP-binding protein
LSAPGVPNALNAPFLQLDRLEKRYGAGPPAVASLSLDIARGELLGLLGPSGCGKTTVLRMVAGLTPGNAGRVVVDGRDVTALPPYRRDMGIVFQNYALFPHMDVAANIAFGLQMRRLPRAQVAERVARALDLVRLAGLGHRRPRELSGGQQQRVALARALVIEPQVLLLDEPLSNLDARLRDEMRGEIRDIQQRLGITTIFVTHDQAEALAMCDRIAVMQAGRLEQLATPHDIYEHPASPFVADFVGRINRLDAVRGDDGALHAGALAMRGAPGAPGPVTVMIRPHRMAFGHAANEDWNAWDGVVRRVTYIGDVLQCDVTCGAVPLTVERHTQPGAFTPLAGEAVSLCWRVSDTLVFPRPAAPQEG